MAIQQKNNRFSGAIHGAVLLAALQVYAPSRAAEMPPAESPAHSSNPEYFTDRASELAMRAMALVGIQYKYDGNSPENGLDCSGLVHFVFKEAWGTALPRTTEELSRVGQEIGTHELRPGDLVFYNTLKRAFSHVGVYLGDNKFVHSPSSGGKVRIERMDVHYWQKRFNGARRIADPEQSAMVGLRPSNLESAPVADHAW